MVKRFIFIILMIFSFSVFAEDFILSTGDELKITILSDFEGLEFLTTVNKNGNIFLYKLRQEYNNSTFDMKLTQNNELQANPVAFEKLYVKGMNLEELKTKIASIYDKVLYVKDIEIELISIKDRVYFDFGNSIAYRRFEREKTYRNVLSEFKSGINYASDSVFVRNGMDLKKKSLDDTLKSGDYVYIKKDIVFITGEIKYPKALPFNPNFKARDYIASSGGLTHYGSFLGIKVKDENGRPKNSKGKIMPGDEIYVPANYLAYLRDLTPLMNLLVTILIAIVTTGIISF